MWEIPRNRLKINLPKGLRLFEDVDFVYLHDGEIEVAKFSRAGVQVAKIEKAARDYLVKMEK